MDYVAICVAILLWLIRPQDWMTGLAGVGFAKYAMIVAMLGLVGRAKRDQVSFSLQTPNDTFIWVYLLWIIYTTGEYFDTFKEVLPFAFFYFLTALILDQPRKLSGFLSCWVFGLIVVVVFALSTHYGFEFAEGSTDLTNLFDGRLALNTWIFNNPNSLGHGVVGLIPIAYVWLWWKRGLLSRLLALLVIAASGFCVYLTQSKGAYLCGFAAFGIVFLFRKRLVIQSLVVVLALTAGVAAIKLLPRMNTLSSQEDGIAGRLAIWRIAHSTMENTFVGEGWKKFEAWVSIPQMGSIRKATHGSYVNVGADLGYPGLFLFLAILYVNGRVVYFARPPLEDIETQRNQRALLSLFCSYASSAWMIDRAYHTDFFFIAGAIAAFQRQMLKTDYRSSNAEHEGNNSHFSLVPQPQGQYRLAYSKVVPNDHMDNNQHDRSSSLSKTLEVDGSSSKIAINAQEAWLRWRKIGWLDLLLILGLFEAVLYVWAEIMKNFISF